MAAHDVSGGEQSEQSEDDKGLRRPFRLQRKHTGPSKAHKRARGGGILSRILALVGASAAARGVTAATTSSVQICEFTKTGPLRGGDDNVTRARGDLPSPQAFNASINEKWDTNIAAPQATMIGGCNNFGCIEKLR